MPDNLMHCWHWFLELNNTRSSGFGMSPITYLEIQAYFDLIRMQVEPWEVEMIKLFDAVAMKFAEEEQAKAERNRPKK